MDLNTQNTSSDCNTINGISCEVDTCKYNNGCCCCTAKTITVKNRLALMGEETKCATYLEI